MDCKHGLNQYRLSRAKSYTQLFMETLSNIKLMYQMYSEGLIDNDITERYITCNINELDRNWEDFKGYIEQRDDMC
ncbi:hypothetical protein [Paenibacillus sp. FSL H3-0286]|uniref:hypothetical protein n=1 Tax=Paenibacillus sp. FSL H3-0286 TaxID=2921427 RepID=UPI003248FEB5